MKLSAKSIAYLAVMVALASIANIFAIPLDTATKQISFAYIPAFIAGAYMGPIAGAIVGGMGDIIGCLIAPQGPWMPLITLSSILLGVIPGVVFKLLRELLYKKISGVKARIIMVWISIFAVLLICTSCLTTLNTWYVYAYAKGSSKTFFAYLFARLPLQGSVAIINGVLLTAMLAIGSVDRFLKSRGDEFLKKLPDIKKTKNE